MKIPSYSKTILVAFLFLIGISGIFRLEIVTSYLRLFDHQHASFLQFSETEKNFGQNELIAIAIAPKQGSIIQPLILQSLQKLTTWVEQQPYVRHVESLTRVMISPPKLAVGQSSNADIISLYDYLQQQKFSPAALQTIQSYVMQHGKNYLYHTLVGQDLKTAVVIIEYQLPDHNKQWQSARDQVLASVTEQVQQLQQQHPEWQVQASGTLFINKTFIDVMTRDAVWMSLVLHLVAIGFLFFLYRSWLIIMTTLVIIDISVLLTLGFQGWLGIPLTQINSPASAIVMTLTLCSCVHIWTHAALKKITIQTSWLQMKKAIFITSMTTAVGFASLMSVNSAPFRELAYVASLGILSSYLSVYFIFPSIAHRLKDHPIKLHIHFIQWIQPWVRFAVRYPWIIMLTVLLSSGYLITRISSNQLDDNMKDYFSEKLPVRQSMDFIESKLGGWDRLSIVLTVKNQQDLYNPALYQNLEQLEAWLMTQPEIVQVISPIDFLEQLQQLFAPNKPLSLKNNTQIEELLSSASLSEQGEKELSLYFNESAHQVRIMPLIKMLSSRDLLALEKKMNHWLMIHTSTNAKLNITKTQVTSISLMYAYLGQMVIHSMVFGSSLAVLLITLILCWALKSIELGILSLLPNLLPGLLVFGFWGIFFGKVNMGVATVFAISFGVIVDDTVHLLESIHQAFAKQKAQGKIITRKFLNKTLLRVFGQVGSAIITTGLIVCIGFLCLGLSDFTLTKQLGLMVGSTVLIALIFDLMFLPSLMIIYLQIKTQWRNKLCKN